MELYSDFSLWDEDELFVRNEGAVEQSALTILTTPIGGRFFRPDFGSYLNETLFELNDNLSSASLRNSVIAALKQWDTRIELDNAATTVAHGTPTEPHRLDLNLSFKVRGFDGKKIILREEFTGGVTPFKAPECRPFFPDRKDITTGTSIQPLEVTFTPRPNAGLAPLPVMFEVAVSGGMLSAWTLTFGDGSDAVVGGRLGYSTNVPHTYVKTGIYRATLDWTSVSGISGKLYGLVKVIGLSRACALPMTVRLENDTIAEKKFLLSPVEMEGLTVKCPLTVSGRWDGETYINLVNKNLDPKLTGTELVSFFKDGSLITVWAWS